MKKYDIIYIRGDIMRPLEIPLINKYQNLYYKDKLI